MSEGPQGEVVVSRTTPGAELSRDSVEDFCRRGGVGEMVDLWWITSKRCWESERRRRVLRKQKVAKVREARKGSRREKNGGLDRTISSWVSAQSAQSLTAEPGSIVVSASVAGDGSALDAATPRLAGKIV
jgi:hypothetical protein